ncbi:carbon-nitrogen hydrolase [Paraphysoderma sedebokerense]|nr:carbon-nitrogen hydrolase [Paraphysoderma sedebokerense]
MKIALVQFNPKLKQVESNIAKVEELLERAALTENEIDVLLLPEMAFTGYVFTSKSDVEPYAEMIPVAESVSSSLPSESVTLSPISSNRNPSELSTSVKDASVRQTNSKPKSDENMQNLQSTQGKTLTWCKETAVKLNCWVVCGVPEYVIDDLSPVEDEAIESPDDGTVKSIKTKSAAKGNRKSSNETENESGVRKKYYNSQVIVNRSGEIVKVYRKHFLYETDENWACEGEGFSCIETEFGKTSFGICMDINPYRFISPFTAFEYGHFHVSHKPSLMLLSMAWLDSDPSDPEEETYDLWNYWVTRLKPLIGSDVTVCICNRTGEESDVSFGGGTVVLKMGKQPRVVAGLGKREEKVLLVDI